MHIHLDEPSLSVCPKCGTPMRPHTVCKNCGYYNGEQIIDVTAKLNRKEKKKKEKELKEAEKQPKEGLSMEEMSKQ